ncbi:hypothetical protein ScPMuIL_010588 [Solemya velum]
MTDYTKKQSLVEYKLKTTKLLLERTKREYEGELMSFQVYRELYQKNKAQLADMDKLESPEIDRRLYDLICKERDENKKRAQLSKANCRVNKEACNKLKCLLEELSLSIEEMKKAFGGTLTSYEELLNLCISEEKALFSLKKKYKAGEEERRYLVSLQSEIKNDEQEDYLLKRIHQVEITCKLIDVKFREALQISQRHKQELTEKSVSLIKHWTEGDATGKLHVFNLWEKCIQNSTETFGTSITDVIRTLMKNNTDFLRDLCVGKSDVSKEQKTSQTLKAENSTRGSGDTVMNTGDQKTQNSPKTYKALGRGSIEKNTRKSNKLQTEAQTPKAKTLNKKPWFPKQDFSKSYEAYSRTVRPGNNRKSQSAVAIRPSNNMKYQSAVAVSLRSAVVNQKTKINTRPWK